MLFLVPRTNNVGFLLICSYLGGAIAVNLFLMNAGPAVPAALLALFWVGMYWRNKAVFVNKPAEG